MARPRSCLGQEVMQTNIEYSYKSLSFYNITLGS